MTRVLGDLKARDQEVTWKIDSFCPENPRVGALGRVAQAIPSRSLRRPRPLGEDVALGLLGVFLRGLGPSRLPGVFLFFDLHPVLFAD